MTRRRVPLVLIGMLVTAAWASEGTAMPFFFIHMADPQLFWDRRKRGTGRSCASCYLVPPMSAAGRSGRCDLSASYNMLDRQVL